MPEGDGSSDAAKKLSQAIILGCNAMHKGQKAVFQATKMLRGIDLRPADFTSAAADLTTAINPNDYESVNGTEDYTALVTAAGADKIVNKVIHNADIIYANNNIDAVAGAAGTAGALIDAPPPAVNADYGFGTNPVVDTALAGSAVIANKVLYGGKSRKHRRGKANKTKGKGGKKRRTRHIKH